MPDKNQSILMGIAIAVVVTLLIQILTQQLLTGMASSIMGIFGCLLSFALAAVPVWHYTETHKLTIPAGAGAGMGAITLIGAFVIVTVLQFAAVALGLMPDPQVVMLDELEAQGATQEQIDMALQFSSPLISVGIGAVVSAIIGAIGGAIGAAIFKKGEETGF